MEATCPGRSAVSATPVRGGSSPAAVGMGSPWGSYRGCPRLEARLSVSAGVRVCSLLSASPCQSTGFTPVRSARYRSTSRCVRMILSAYPLPASVRTKVSPSASTKPSSSNRPRSFTAWPRLVSTEPARLSTVQGWPDHSHLYRCFKASSNWTRSVIPAIRTRRATSPSPGQRRTARSETKRMNAMSAKAGLTTGGHLFTK